jgi:hypothetical protein
MKRNGTRTGIVAAILFFLVFPFFGLGPEVLSQESKLEAYRKVFDLDLPYGRGPGHLGLHYLTDQPPRGPESFSSDAEGNLYLCDTVNQKISIWSPRRRSFTEFSLSTEISPNDIALDSRGQIYVFDALKGKLHQIDKSGNVLTSVAADDSHRRVRGPIHVVGDLIYMAGGDQEDILIGKIDNGILNSPAIEATSTLPGRGIHGASGKRYYLRLIRGKGAMLEISHPDSALFQSLELKQPNLLSIQFLGEDRKENFYLQTEFLENQALVLEVQKFNGQGLQLASVRIPENNYQAWSVKLLSVDENGTIHQFLPARDKGRLRSFGFE